MGQGSQNQRDLVIESGIRIPSLTPVYPLARNSTCLPAPSARLFHSAAAPAALAIATKGVQCHESAGRVHPLASSDGYGLYSLNSQPEELPPWRSASLERA